MLPRLIPTGIACLALIVAFAAWGQAAPRPAANPLDIAPLEGKQAEKGVVAPKRPAFRDTTGYRYPAISRTLRDMQNLAHAMQLRDYCADDRVSDDFVKEQLARFSRITGREETCRTLLDY